MRGILLLLTLLAVAAPVATAAAAAPEDERPVVGLVLSGGGARGAAHVGVLQVLEEEGVPVDLVIGTSMGAVVGSLYASGYDADEIDRILRGRNWASLLTDSVERQRLAYRRKEEDNRYLQGFEVGITGDGVQLPRAVLGGRSFSFMLRQLLDEVDQIHDFDRLPIPFRAVATDLADGGLVVLGDGDLVTAVRASAAFPGGFAPVTIEGRTLVDGGLAANLPVEVARAMGAEVIIAVNIGTTVADIEEIRDALGVASQVVSILTDQNVHRSRRALTDDDLYVEPPLDAFSSAAFSSLPAIIDVGRAEAERLRPEIQALVARIGGPVPRPEHVADTRLQVASEVVIEGNERVPTAQIQARIEIQPGMPLEGDRLHEDLDRIYSIGDFEQVDYRLTELADGGDRLRYIVTEKPWGPWYLRAGLRIENDFQGSGDFSVLASIRRSQINDLGAEWRTELDMGLELGLWSEFYQPLDRRGSFFVAPELYWTSADIHGPGGTLSWRHYRTAAALDLGWTPGGYGEVRLGVELGEDRLSPDGLAPVVSDERVGRIVLDATLDQLDDAYLPREGTLIRLRVDDQTHSLGADLAFDRYYLSGLHALPLSDTISALVAFEYGDADSEIPAVGVSPDQLPLQDQFELGGLGRLSGLPTGALRGDSMLLFRALVHGPLLPDAGLGSPLRWGVSLEAGDVFLAPADLDLSELRVSGAVFVAVESPIGALFLGAGHTEPGETAFHLVLGRPF